MASSSTSTTHTFVPLPQVPGTDPSRCALELFRTAVAKKLVDAFPDKLSLDQAYAGVDYGKKGEDFTVALPRFRLGGKVDELAAQVTSKVRKGDLSSLRWPLTSGSLKQTTTWPR